MEEDEEEEEEEEEDRLVDELSPPRPVSSAVSHPHWASRYPFHTRRTRRSREGVCVCVNRLYTIETERPCVLAQSRDGDEDGDWMERVLVHIYRHRNSCGVS